MQALIQRVSQASVSVDENVIGTIGPGLVVLIGVSTEDNEDDAKYLAEKIVGLRIFSDADGKFNLSVQDISGRILAISQFTLLANTRKGRRPSFTRAAAPEKAQALIAVMIDSLRASGLSVETGKFAAHMLVEIHNDGPVTISIDSADRFNPRK